MGSALGAAKTAARRIGVTLEEYQERVAAGEKWCTACRTWLLVDAFERDRSRSDGRKASCRTHGLGAGLRGPAKAERRGRAAEGQVWCSHCRAWLPSTEVRSGLCRDGRNDLYRRYYSANPAKIRQRSMARRAMVEPIPLIGREAMYEEWAGLCAYCPAPATTHDHIVPISAGGRTDPCNVVPACLPCNSGKGKRDPVPWIERGFKVHPEAWERFLELAAEDLSVLFDLEVTA